MAGGDFKGLSCPAIVGPTASGKTSLVTALAARLPLEVISLDSRQIYRGLRIGTAQPTTEEQAICPHHLVDFVSPDEKYDAARFRQDFERAYTEIKDRGGVPILAGGAGMYLKTLVESFMDIPGNSLEKLAQARAEVARWTEEELRDKLKQVDPDSFERIHPNDTYRKQRALEIYLISGQTMTELSLQHQHQPSLGLNFPAFVLERPVPELDDRIALRTEQMLAAGWIEETHDALGKHDPQGPGLQSIGYREIVNFLNGELTREELTAAIILVTRQYAKRQRTWFRKVEPAFRGHPESEELLERVLGELG